METVLYGRLSDAERWIAPVMNGLRPTRLPSQIGSENDQVTISGDNPVTARKERSLNA